MDDFRTLHSLYHDVESVLNRLDLTPEGIRFYAESVMRFKVFQVSYFGLNLSGELVLVYDVKRKTKLS